jgi:hypothetical protein
MKRKWVRQVIDYYEALEKKFGVDAGKPAH